MQTLAKAEFIHQPLGRGELITSGYRSLACFSSGVIA
jgi:hypothetical protein